MKPSISNFIPLNRKIFKHEFWLEKRPYSRFEAWLDLLATARFDTGEGRMLIGCTIVRWNRGELVASIRYLVERWDWSKHKVDNFIKLLKKENMIKTRTPSRTSQTIITICNYETYNSFVKITGHQNGQDGDSTGTQAGQDRDKTNKENKEQQSKHREVYRAFAHLILFADEFELLKNSGFAKSEIDQILDEVENYKGNKKYTSLYLTAKKWLQKEKQVAAQKEKATGGRIVNIAGAFQDALRHG